MARLHPGTADLVHLLDAMACPFYVLDDEARIIFCNQACLDWLGLEATAVQGVRCRYQTSAGEGAESVAAGLCPPPPVLAGQEMAATVACVRPDGGLSRRRARFFPLEGEDGLAGIIALVEAEDCDPAAGEPTSAPSETAEALALHEQLRALRHQLSSRYAMDRLVGTSPAMVQVRAQVELAAASTARVVIVGPPGSGRQHLASTIHYAQGLEAGSLIALACALLDPELVGATLSALATQGARSATSPGTLLLNDADRLPADVQRQVAEALASRSFPLRVIATARQPLAALARQGLYREDLAALLSTLVIELPPLAERREDIPLLAQFFVEEANRQGEKQVLGFSPQALDLLAGYSWPGNVDELIEVVRFGHRQCAGPHIEVRDLPARLHEAASAALHPPRPQETIVLDEFLAGIERELLRRAMARAKGNKAKAARLLGVTRPRLYRRLVQLGLEPPKDSATQDTAGGDKLGQAPRDMGSQP